MNFNPVKKIGILWAALIFLSSAYSQESREIEFDPAFVHAVYFWLHNPDDPADRRAFESSMNTLLETSKFTKTNYLGTPPKAIRDVVDDTFTYFLLVTFESGEAQEAYQVEAAHLKFIEDAGHLWKKVVVYDAVDKLND